MRGLSQLVAVGHVFTTFLLLSPAAAQNGTRATNDTETDNVVDLELFWSYERSPPVYPSRKSIHLWDLLEALPIRILTDITQQLSAPAQAIGLLHTAELLHW